MWTCKNRENMSKNHIFICNMHGNNVVKYAELNTNQSPSLISSLVAVGVVGD